MWSGHIPWHRRSRARVPRATSVLAGAGRDPAPRPRLEQQLCGNHGGVRGPRRCPQGEEAGHGTSAGAGAVPEDADWVSAGRRGTKNVWGQRGPRGGGWARACVPSSLDIMFFSLQMNLLTQVKGSQQGGHPQPGGPIPLPWHLAPRDPVAGTYPVLSLGARGGGGEWGVLEVCSGLGMGASRGGCWQGWVLAGDGCPQKWVLEGDGCQQKWVLAGDGCQQGMGPRLALPPLPTGEHPGADPASPGRAFPPALALARLLGATGLGVLAQGPWPEAQAGGWQQSGQGPSRDAAALAPISPASLGLMPGVCPSR